GRRRRTVRRRRRPEGRRSRGRKRRSVVFSTSIRRWPATTPAIFFLRPGVQKRLKFLLVIPLENEAAEHHVGCDAIVGQRREIGIEQFGVLPVPCARTRHPHWRAPRENAAVG